MSESFEKLQNRILSDAKVQAEDIIREAEEKARQTLEQAKTRALKEADETLSRARLEAEALRRRILSSRIRANRLRILEEKNRIVQQVMQSVENALADITADERVPYTLRLLVTEGGEAGGGDEPIVRIGFREISKNQTDAIGKSVSKGTKLVIDEQALDGLGGVVASDPEGKILYNNSFKARLDRLASQLLTLISSTIFRE